MKHGAGTIFDRILRALTAAGTRGMPSKEIAEAIGVCYGTTRQKIFHLRLEGELFGAGPLNLTRYYIRESYAKAADEPLHVQSAEIKRAGRLRRDAARKARMEAMRALMPPKPPKPPKVEKPKRSKAQQAHTLAVQRQASEASPWRKDTTMPPRMKRRDLPVVIPDGVKVTRAATPVDYRFHVDPSHRGEFSEAGIGRYLETA